MGTTHAAEPFPELRVADAYRGVSDTYSISAAWFGPAPAWTRADRLEYSAGIIEDPASLIAFGFAGPVWRLTDATNPVFAEASFGPTLLSGSTVDGRELGGNLHFQSALMIGATFGNARPLRVSLRIAHISNGGLRSRNPGLDFIGLSLSPAMRQSP